LTVTVSGKWKEAWAGQRSFVVTTRLTIDLKENGEAD